MTYRYVGPAEILRQVAGSPGGRVVASPADLREWLAEADEPPEPDGSVPATFIVDGDGRLRLAPRRTEHVACAEGGEVLAAGELFLRGETVVGATNQSTGYCPRPESWAAVAAALDAAGLPHPGGYTAEFVFRRCEACQALNVVKDGWLVCAVCDAPLPPDWNCTGR